MFYNSEAFQNHRKDGFYIPFYLNFELKSGHKSNLNTNSSKMSYVNIESLKDFRLEFVIGEPELLCIYNPGKIDQTLKPFSDPRAKSL